MQNRTKRRGRGDEGRKKWLNKITGKGEPIGLKLREKIIW